MILSRNPLNNCRKGSLLFLVLFLVFYFVPTLTAAEVFIPSQLAQTRERLEGQNGKTIVILEEAHVAYNAQKALAEILRDLIQNESFQYVFVEGGWGDVSLTQLRRLAGLEQRQKVGEQYLREGKISGEEYLNLATDLDIRLWGVEDPELYQANMDVFLKLSSVQTGLLKELEAFKTQLFQLETKILSKSQTEILTQRRNFETQKISLLDYAQFLMKRLPLNERHCEEPVAASKAGDVAISHSKNEIASLPSVARNDRQSCFSHVAQLISFSGADGSYDSDKIVLEKQAAIQFLSKQLTKPEFEDILALEQQKTLEGELYFLEILLNKIKDFSKKQPVPNLKNLSHYHGMLQEAARIDSGMLFQEIADASRAAFLAGEPTPEQKNFFEILWGVGMLEKLFDLRLTETEFLALEKDRNPFPLKKWNDSLAREFPQGSLVFQPLDASKIAEWIPAAFSFYQTARIREKAMLDNMTSEITAKNIDRAFLVTGGFHSKNFLNLLKNQGYTVLLVSPRFVPEDDKTTHAQYLEVLKDKWTELQSTAAKLEPQALPEAQHLKFGLQNSKSN